MLWQFLVLLIVHWFADFILQTHWQASNKSKNNVALFRHVLVYAACLAAASFVVFAPWLHGTGLNWLGFVMLNWLLHFATDYCTSRWTSKLFMRQFVMTRWSPLQLSMIEGFSLHDFFVVVGFDQLIHQVTLAGTMVLFFGGR